jgi:hypothetical protein
MLALISSSCMFAKFFTESRLSMMQKFSGRAEVSVVLGLGRELLEAVMVLLVLHRHASE